MKSFGTRLGIGELARLAGCRVDTVRYYERIGLMPKPERTAGGQRRYTDHQTRQLLFIRRLRQLGFSIGEAGDFLTLRQRSYSCTEFMKVPDARIANIRQQIAELRQLERRIRDIRAHCAEGVTTNCRVIDVLWNAEILDLQSVPRVSVCCGTHSEAELATPE